MPTEVDELIRQDTFSGPKEFLRDWRGNLYGVDSIILYPRQEGRSCEMQEGRVTEIRPYVKERWNYAEKKEETSTKYKVMVLPIRSSRFQRYADPPKPVTILITQNITAVT